MTFLTESWFWRGTQSALFYYLSCAPCTKISDQRRKKKEAKRAIAERKAEGDIFQHPLPTGTNPYWNEEITLGPGPPSKKAARDRTRRMNKATPEPPVESRTSGSAGATSNDRTDMTSPDLMDGIAASHDGSEGEQDGWNKKRYQREDEPLWGLEYISTESSNGAKQTSGKRAHDYYRARNPEVNDLHPPVVSTQPVSSNETRWMLQPPPRAKVMEGKERANRSRSASGNSKGTVAGSSLNSRGNSRRSMISAAGSDLRYRTARHADEKRARANTLSSSVKSSRKDDGLGSLDGFTNGISNSTGQRHDRDRVTKPVASSAGLKRTRSAPRTSKTLTRESDRQQSTLRPPLSSRPSASNTLWRLDDGKAQRPTNRTNSRTLRPDNIELIRANTDHASAISPAQKARPLKQYITKRDDDFISRADQWHDSEDDDSIPTFHDLDLNNSTMSRSEKLGHRWSMEF